MKTITFLTSVFMLAATFQDVSAAQEAYNSESFASKSKHKPRERERDGVPTHGAPDPTTPAPNQTQPQPVAPSASTGAVYCYFTLPDNASVESGTPVIFGANGKQTGGIRYDLDNASFSMPQNGDYQITFHINLDGNAMGSFGVLVNDHTLLPGSIFRSSGQLSGTLIASLKKGDIVRIVNVTNQTLELNNDADHSCHNASIFIQKLN